MVAYGSSEINLLTDWKRNLTLGNGGQNSCWTYEQWLDVVIDPDIVKPLPDGNGPTTIQVVLFFLQDKLNF